MKQAKWLGIVVIERLGWQGAVALGLIAVWAAFHAFQIYPLAQKLAGLRAAAAGEGRAAFRHTDVRKELEVFKASFRQGTLEGQLKHLNESGKTTGVTLKRIDYRMLEERRSGLKQYQITMPVTSSYPNIRKFTSLALASIPGLALDHVQFQRRRIGDAAIEAELRFTLFLADPA